MLNRIRKSRFMKVVSCCLIISILSEIVFPVSAWALTGGPSQPEVQSFEPVGTTDMVDLFTGDYNYNIPLLDVGGYPVNISYHAGATMDEEASWVGLGWNINPGVVNRSMRGIPDDFNGDIVSTQTNIKANHTYGVTASINPELVGIKLGLVKTSVSFGLSYNNYKGFALSASIDPTIAAAESNKTSLTAGLGLSVSSANGVGIEPSVGLTSDLEYRKTGTQKTTAKFGLPFNSMTGLKSLTFSSSAENKPKKASWGGSADLIKFGSPTYIPQVTLPMFNLNLSFNIKAGSEAYFLHPNATIIGYYAGQYLAMDTKTVNAYGYMYSQNTPLSTGHFMMDFNREKDGPYSKNVPNLPVTNYTYDMYSVSGQGIGGTYRPFRGDIGVVYDDIGINSSVGIDFPALEVGGGNGAHFGANVSVNTCTTISGVWAEDNELYIPLRFKENPGTNDNLYEPCYFKSMGEKTGEKESNEGLLDKIGGYDPVKIQITENLNARSNLITKDNRTIPLSGDANTRNKRQRRNETVSILTAEEATNFGLEKMIRDYSSDFTFNSTLKHYDYSSIERSSLVRNKSHISEITAYRADGSRYVYGVPAYNLLQQEVTFAITEGNPNCSNGLVSYAPNKDNTLKNEKGQDHYFQKVDLPPYAHSYLLTAVLSSDYVDKTGNGPTDDDLGTYTKINYSKLPYNYRWRTPYEKANYNEGLKSRRNDSPEGSDDKANYVYGMKEIWYVHSIETKTHIAEFVTTDREDGLGTLGPDGGKDLSQRLKKLDMIKLYSRQEKIKSVKESRDAVPIKTVHFDYDYSLCPGTENTSAVDFNKLTLKSLWFTYGNSMRGKLTKYSFEYGQYFNSNGTTVRNTLTDFSYNMKGYDRWGNFKPNPINCTCNINDALTNAEFPYTNQEKIKKTGDPLSPIYDDKKSNYLADFYAVAWNLSTITLPSGGKIKVEYEADDYAYVQNKRAMQMFKVVGALKAKPETLNLGSNALYGANFDPNYFLIIKLPNKYTAAQFKRDFLSNVRGNSDCIDKMYFKFLVNIDCPLYTDDPILNSRFYKKWEYVQGYASIDSENCGMITGEEEYAYIKLQDQKLEDIAPSLSTEYINPISAAAWNFAKLYRKEVAYNQNEVGESKILAVVDAIVSAISQVGMLIDGFQDFQRKSYKASIFKPEKSWVRLYNPEGIKKGGGARVKRLLISDEWTNGIPAVYGQEYNYTTSDQLIKQDGTIESVTYSSGVAAYEPAVGGDENPWREPVNYANENTLAPDDKFYMEKPFGESFFPAPVVGYSKVTVKNIKKSSITKHGTGYVVNEFYTAKDFPTIADFTGLEQKPHKTNPVFSLLKVYNEDFMTTSQGYVVELNDMHGKSKKQMVYEEGNNSAPISGMEYYYKILSPPRRGTGSPMITTNTGALDNKAPVIFEDGSIRNDVNIGIDYDFVIDMREHSTEVVEGGIGGNIDIAMIGLFPIPAGLILPKFSYEKTRYRTAVTTKVIQKYGLLDRVVKYDQLARVETKNLLYDGETGEVLLTQTLNKFGDPVYNFTYPAHWGYKTMGQVYKTLGAWLSSTSPQLCEGDEVAYLDGTTWKKAWVTTPNSTPPASSIIYFINEAGEKVTPSATVKIIRPGRRNMQGVAIGSIVSRANPLKNNSLVFEKVLNASAIEYGNTTGLLCGQNGVNIGIMFNPYLQGALGYWKPSRTWAYLTDRTQSRSTNDNLNIREDGLFTTFNPFWELVNSSWKKNPKNWTYSSEVTIFSPYGFELENRDALGRYSSAVYGYNQTLPLAVAGNAKYSEIAFDGFEDYDLDANVNNHFSFKKPFDVNNPNNQLNRGGRTMKTAHTGRYSVEVKSDGSAPFSQIFIEKKLIKCD